MKIKTIGDFKKILIKHEGSMDFGDITVRLVQEDVNKWDIDVFIQGLLIGSFESVNKLSDDILVENAYFETSDRVGIFKPHIKHLLIHNMNKSNISFIKNLFGIN